MEDNYISASHTPERSLTGLEKLEMTVGVEMVEMGREVLVGDTIKANKSIDVCLYKALKWVHVNLYICILINVRISNSVPKQFTKTLSLKNIVERDLMPNSKQAKSIIEAWILNFTNYKKQSADLVNCLSAGPLSED